MPIITSLLANFDTFLWIVYGVVALTFGLMLFLVSRLFSLWLQAWLSGVPVSMMDLIGMKFRKVDPKLIVYSRIQAMKAGINLGTPILETHYLASGDVRAVVNAMIAADRANIALPWQQAAAIDLAGYDVHATTEAALKENIDTVTLEYAKKRGLRKQRSGAIGER